MPRSKPTPCSSVRRSMLALIGGAGLLLSVGQARAQVGINLRLMPLGDSITEGYLSTDGNGYRGALFTTLSGQVGTLDFVGSRDAGTMVDPDNEGHIGDKINDIASIIDGELKTYKPNIIALHIGSNDLNGGYEVSTAPDRLAALIDQIVADEPDATVMVAQLIVNGVATTEARIQAYNAQIPAIVEARAKKGEHVLVVSMSSLTTADLQDKLHPNDTGYQKMAANWDTGVKKAIANGWIVDPIAGSLAHPVGTIASGVAGLCLNDQNNSTTSGAAADISACSNDPSQQWDANAGMILIHGECLDVDDGGSANGTPVDVRTCNGNASQQWTNVRGTLVNSATHKCLDDPNSSTATGTQLDIWTCNGGDNQKWQLPSVGSVTSGINGKCLDNYGGFGANLNPVDIYTCNQTHAQLWRVSNNLMRIQGKCLDITGGGTADGTPVEIYQCTGRDNQTWVPAMSMLVNPASGKCLDDPKGSTTNSTQLDLATCTGAASQKWVVPSY